MTRDMTDVWEIRTQKMMARVADLASEGVYEPGQYCKLSDFRAGAVTEDEDHNLSFIVEDHAPDSDARRVRVTVSPA